MLSWVYLALNFMKPTKISIEKQLIHCSELREQGRLKESLTCVTSLIDSGEDNDLFLVDALILQSAIHRDLGNSDAALATLDEALSLAESKSLNSQKADILRQQSYLLIEMGKQDKAKSLAFESLDIARDFSLKREEADAIACIGHGFENNRDFQKALCWYQEGLDICDAHGLSNRKATLTGDIGKVYGIIGQLPESILFLKKALDLATEINYEKAIISSLYRLGDAYRSIEDKEKARDCYANALERSKAEGFRREQGDALYRLGLLETANGNPDEALKLISESLDIFEQINFIRQKIYCLLAIGHALEQKGDISGALDKYFAAFETIRDSINEHVDPFIQVIESITNQWLQLHYIDEATELSRLTDQLREHASMSGVFEDFGKREKLERLIVNITAIVAKTRKMEGNIYSSKGLSIDFNTNLVIKDGQEVRLTEDQWKILRCLWKKKGEPCSRSELFAVIGLRSNLETRTIDVQIYKMRRKIGLGLLPAARGQGYSLSMKN